MTTRHSRRSFLQSSAIVSAAALAGGALNGRSARAHTVRDEISTAVVGNATNYKLQPNELPLAEFFKLGVASGDPSHQDIILWTYYEGFFRLVLFVWRVENDGSFIQVASSFVPREDGGFVHSSVEGLAADRRYCYNFVEVDFEGKTIAQSVVGKFKSAAAADVLKPVTLGAVSCINQKHHPVVLAHAALRNDLDGFLLLGDTSYNDSVATLQGYRDRWALNLGKEELIKLRQSTSVIATIDDHEIIDDFDPETIEPERLKAGLRAFFDHLPIRRNTEHPSRIWRKISFGKTVDLFVLDCRTERKPSTADSSKPEYISLEQMRWLKAGLKNSTAAFKVIVNSVPISDFTGILAKDRWQGYPLQREEILGFIDSKAIKGVLWVAGDFHFPSVGRIATEGRGSTSIEVLAGPGAQKANPLGAGVWLSGQFDYSSLNNNYVSLHFNPATMEVEVAFNVIGEEYVLNGPQAVSVDFSKKYYLG